MGEVCLIPKGLTCCLGQRQVLLRPKETIDPRYLFYSLRSPHVRQQIAWNEGTGSTVSNVRIPVLEALKIPRNGDVEAAIGKLLASLDNKIALNHRISETLEAMAQAIFRDWFVDFGPTRRKMAGATDPLEVLGGLIADAGRAEELASLFPDVLGDGGLPVGWSEGRIKDVLELAYGKALPKPKRQAGPYPVYGSGGISGSHIEPLVQGPSVIVGRKGTVGSLFWENRNFYPIDTVFYVRSDKPLPFCFYLLQTLGLEGMNTDAAVPGLNRENVYRLSITLPDQELLEQFGAIGSLLRKRMQHSDEEIRTLTELRDLLLPKLMSGEITLRDVEALTEAAE